jgi:alginate O-acetyltransferase complex protein AlgI
MLFNSLEFALFFPIVTLLYFLFPHKYRWMLLLAASCVFYMAFIPFYILILIVTILIDYFMGILIEDTSGPKRKLYLVISIISTCLVLFFFKYFNFFNSSFSALAGFLHLKYPIGIINIILPIGLSFHTFQSLSYVIEVYRGHQKAERHFGIYSLYVMFYPQLVAGPIERPQNLLHQFRVKHNFDYKRVTDGLKLMAWGLFQKIVVADRLAEIVNQIYANPKDFNGLALIIAAILFSFQIYCDFSGYSDIAIGAANVMGFKLMDNFRLPYLSHSISEFWKRWHISLSTWFRDYLYIPMGGNRVAKWNWQLNIFITFLLSGLWHGANWTFIMWGALHGFYLVFAIWTKSLRNYIINVIGLTKHKNILNILQVLTTFSLVSFALILFRSENLVTAWYIISHLFYNINQTFDVANIKHTVELLGLSNFELFTTLLSFITLIVIRLTQNKTSINQILLSKPWWFRWSLYYALVCSIILFGVFGQNNFIYFQF